MKLRPGVGVREDVSDQSVHHRFYILRSERDLDRVKLASAHWKKRLTAVRWFVRAD